MKKIVNFIFIHFNFLSFTNIDCFLLLCCLTSNKSLSVNTKNCKINLNINIEIIDEKIILEN